MDRLLKNDTQTCVELTEQEDSDTFLDFIFPEHLLLPNGKTLEGLVDDLTTQGLVSRSSKNPFWTGFPVAQKNLNTNREEALANFFNDVRAAVYKACAVPCL